MIGKSWFLIVILCVTYVLADKYSNEDDVFHMEQREIDPMTGDIIPFEKNLSSGESCINSAECESGCCLRRKGKRGKRVKRCAPKSLPGHRCTDFQLKGGYYKRYCPCQFGDHCKKNVCQNRKNPFF